MATASVGAGPDGSAASRGSSRAPGTQPVGHASWTTSAAAAEAGEVRSYSVTESTVVAVKFCATQSAMSDDAGTRPLCTPRPWPPEMK